MIKTNTQRLSEIHDRCAAKRELTKTQRSQIRELRDDNNEARRECVRLLRGEKTEADMVRISSTSELLSSESTYIYIYIMLVPLLSNSCITQAKFNKLQAQFDEAITAYSKVAQVSLRIEREYRDQVSG